MAAKIMDGLLVSQKVKERLSIQIAGMRQTGRIPCLATILVGNDAPSMVYVNNKQKTAKSIGIKTLDYRLDESVSQLELTDLIRRLNSDSSVHGILLQLPIPNHLDRRKIINTIDPQKDVDGLTIINSGLLLNNQASLVPCTPLGIMELLRYYNIPLDGSNVLIINRSNLVGKPLVSLLLEKDATVTVAHTHTKNLHSFSTQSDIVISAVGKRESFLLTANMVKPGATIIDVGTNRVNGKLCGDVDFETVKEKVDYITPVPGGVGPMTICMLLENTVKAAML
ncbi:MAG TPA: bifunctional 5,10-methylenetetrahydrofolate dehydrogenase/5,10-methenyltetrahydrofolate cyclohydrolase [Candidatus Nitrosocosmicus sp.]|uniref:bifunctional 5,10-methylenetetrahydrofolate dehydrogenase/5,10-methenyltetrahydrofolate cyclohydrolase n=1 Tax=Candidatus Nitrosocosmicus agrestis TaxID=2563600 RepID=UPI0019178990|nr:bifunctional 5,10-methylenetetrahydrofolate dehydrogenase/5,10-methenyltetrahydrofolate cyclohydrolase [Candidatus Nitrosocosmicus sp. SS]HET6590883.1 bifunctional 5,10-methylenetetrahydrofolate dehydrogenase/5,10-methenyltetrahydrofolate cyclohydrolase [Candidatus Nitrosocosmicus sp.]